MEGRKGGSKEGREGGRIEEGRREGGKEKNVGMKEGMDDRFRHILPMVTHF